jgi:hypothetical protein
MLKIHIGSWFILLDALEEKDTVIYGMWMKMRLYSQQIFTQYSVCTMTASLNVCVAASENKLD